MRKKDLADLVADKLGIFRKDSEEYMDVLIDTITETLAGGEKVYINDFGTFDTMTRREHKSNVPFRGGEITIHAKKVAFFKPGTNLKKKIRYS